MTRINCLALHIACVCMQSIYDPILGQTFVFSRQGRISDVDEPIITEKNRKLSFQSPIPSHYNQKRLNYKNLSKNHAKKSYNRMQNK